MRANISTCATYYDSDDIEYAERQRNLRAERIRRAAAKGQAKHYTAHEGKYEVQCPCGTQMWVTESSIRHYNKTGAKPCCPECKAQRIRKGWERRVERMARIYG